MLATVWARPGPNQEPKIPSCSCMQVAGPNYLGQHHCPLESGAKHSSMGSFQVAQSPLPVFLLTELLTHCKTHPYFSSLQSVLCSLCTRFYGCYHYSIPEPFQDPKKKSCIYCYSIFTSIPSPWKATESTFFTVCLCLLELNLFSSQIRNKRISTQLNHDTQRDL